MRPRARLLPAAIALALPLAGLALLLGFPQLDLVWQHHPSHFWIVLGAALLSVALSYVTWVNAARRADARVMLVSLAFLAPAGFLALHALATPGVLLAGGNAGFDLSTPVGIALGAALAALSAREVEGAAAVTSVRRARLLRLTLLTVMAAWAAVSLLELPPLGGGSTPERVSGWFVTIAVAATGLYGFAAVAYLRLWGRRGGLMPLAVAAAFVLLGEAMVAVTLAPNWHLSWWEWHLLLLVAFALVAWGANRQWHEERFADLYLDRTVSGTREMTVLFADLQGFTTFSESHPPDEVRTMLNTYFDAAIPPVVTRHGGVVDRIIGDALMVTFNSLGDQPDHAVQATRAGLALQAETSRIAEQHPRWPRFRVGINTGEVAVGIVGSAGGRTLTVIGDVVNTASRLEGAAPVGRVAISAATLDQLPDGVVTQPLGDLELKGRTEPVAAYVVDRLG
ncbi:adenylate/guanylate cyclase domain-containing protein [Ornithinimicrobium cryptoxanthini]|uniref:Adenylate/guanylate cyclase domain-containing protein n=1 Tax=Ornithinimicrobium cryptoxanthini TaxID=2934161 RepID=A0ABY4YMB8_9MICO|nr:adenylate/guanylate cyclase domain-containing protein [Ornithinimicrobium cryptoxanthini]USQ77935.1 adenylate/guanylate cyclase domain-containing protein [Ornithinimicrobium cryptoxanthini]